MGSLLSIIYIPLPSGCGCDPLLLIPSVDWTEKKVKENSTLVSSSSKVLWDSHWQSAPVFARRPLRSFSSHKDSHTTYDMTASTYTAFFYGTLMHPKILKSVIRNDGSHLQLCPAVLFEFTRHQVKDADYPGMLPVSRGRALFTGVLTREECSVRGTVVKGLTMQDMRCLDTFEGSEYTRESVQVHPLGPFKDISTHTIDEDALVPYHPPPLPSSSWTSPTIDAQTYIYMEARDLNSELWSFDDFVKNNAWKWYSGTR